MRETKQTPWRATAWHGVVAGVLAFAACARGPAEGVTVGGETSGRIVLAVSGGLAGLADTTVVDRSTGLLIRTSCLSIRGAPTSCSASVRSWRVVLSASAMDSLFRLTQTPDFLALKPEYDMSATFVDGFAYELRVATASGMRAVRWSEVPGVPAALTAVRQSIQSRTVDQ